AIAASNPNETAILIALPSGRRAWLGCATSTGNSVPATRDLRGGDRDDDAGSARRKCGHLKPAEAGDLSANSRSGLRTHFTPFDHPTAPAVCQPLSWTWARRSRSPTSMRDATGGRHNTRAHWTLARNQSLCASNLVAYCLTRETLAYMGGNRARFG